MERNQEVFDLQLAVQHLEAELSLYRNGTNASDLLLIISEKDIEIDSLKTSLNDTSEKLRKIAKGSQEVLAKCAILQGEKAEYKEENENLQKSLIESKESYAQCQQEILDLHEELKKYSESCESNSREIQELNDDLSARDDTIVKLQARCAQLLSEKTEKSKLLDKERHDRSKQICEFREELEKAIRINTEIKNKLSQEHAAGFELKIKLKESATEFDALQKSSALTKCRLESELRSTIESNDCQTKAFRGTIESLQQQLEQTITSNVVAEEALRMELQNYKDKASSLEAQLEAAQSTISNQQSTITAQTQSIARYEAEKERFVVHKKDIDVLNIKLKSYEDKIRRQEQYMKSRLLKDRSNICSSVSSASTDPLKVGTSL